MSISFRESSRFSIVLAALLTLLIPICLYFWVRIPNQQEYFARQYLRLLGDMSTQISEKVSNYETILRNASINIPERPLQEWYDVIEATYSNTNLGPRSGISSDSILVRLTTLPENRMYAEALVKPWLESRIDKAFDLVEGLELVTMHVKLGRRNVIEANYEDKFSEFDASEDDITRIEYYSSQNLEMKYERGGYWLHVYSEVYQRKYEYTTDIHVRIRLDSLLSPILARSQFDDLLLLDANGEVRFQQRPREVHTVRLDTLRGLHTATLLKSLVGASKVADVTLGGTEYKLFVQPLTFPSMRLDESSTVQRIDWLLGGLVENSRFTSQSRSISISWVIAFFVAVLLAVISLPLFKLWAMGHQDLLRRRDVVFLLISMVIGTAVVVLILLDITYYQELKYEMEKSLEEISSSIEQSFNKELGAIGEVLHDFIQETDSLVQATDTVYVRNDVVSHIYPFFSNLSLIDASGRQRIKWSRGNQPTPLINVGTRAYFQQARQGELWRIESLKDDSSEVDSKKGDSIRVDSLFVEPIFSWNTGQNLVVVSVPTPKSNVAALSARLISMTNPVLPSTIRFAVLDQEGEVLFHQDENRNLRENFFAESDENEELINAVKLRVPKTLNASYQGQDHRYYVRPIKGAPWVLVVFQDRHVMRTANLQTLAEAGMLFLVYLSILAVLFFFRMAWTHVKYNRQLSYGILWPSSLRVEAYLQIVLANAVLAATVIGVILLAHTYQLLHVMVLVPIFSVMLAYRNLKLPGHATKGSAPDIDRNDHWRHGLWLRLKYFRYAVVVAAILWCISAISLEPRHTEDYLTFIVLLAGTVGAFFIVSAPFKQQSPISDRQSTHRSKNAPLFRRNYLLAIFSLVAITSILPVIGMFKIAFDTENALRIRQRLFRLGETLEEHCERLTISCFDDRSGKLTDMAKWSIHIAGFAEDNTDDKDVVESSTWPDWIRALFVMVRPRFNDLVYETNAIIERTDHDHVFRKTEDGILMPAGSPVPPVSLYASLPVFKSAFVLDGPARWLWLLGMPPILIILFVLIRSIADQVVLLSLEEPTNVDIHDIVYGARNTNFLIIGPPNSGKSRLFVGKENIIQIDDLKNTDVLRRPEDLQKIVPRPSIRRWVLDHFEHNMEDPEWNREKLGLVKRMLETTSVPIVIISTVIPPEGEWKAIFDSFLPYYMHGQSQDEDFDSKLSEKKKPALDEKKLEAWEIERIESLCRYLREECRPFDLHKVGEIILGLKKFGMLSLEELRSLFLEWARQDYRLIWSTCSEPQKLILSQLAQEGFVNVNLYKSTILRELLRKGLVRFDPELRLMNSTFRDYLLLPEVQDEVDELIEHHGASTWQKIKMPLLTVLIGVSLFIFITQQEVFNVTLAWMSAVATALPVMFKVFSMLLPSSTAEAGGE